MKAIRLCLFLLVIVGTMIIVMNAASDESDCGTVEVTFEEGITVVCIDRTGGSQPYPQYTLNSSPSMVNDTHHIRAVPQEVEYGNIYLNGISIGSEGIAFPIADHLSGIHFEVFRDDYTIHFRDDEGIETLANSITSLGNGSVYSIPSVVDEPLGKTLIGWKTSINGNVPDIEFGNYTIDLDFLRNHYSLSNNSLTLYPVWEEINYSFVFGSNGGSGQVPNTLSNKTITSGVTIPTISLSKIGYSSSVWNTEENGSGIDLSPGTKTIDGAFITTYFGNNTQIHLYPKWVVINYSFVFGSNGGSGQVPNTLSNKTITSGVTIPTISLSKIGYSSSVWNTEENGSGIDLSPGTKTIDGAFITTYFGNNTQIHLYPKWVVINYSFVFGSNGGSGQVPNTLSNKTITSGVNIPTISLSKIGYSSSVWNTEEDGNGLDLDPGEKILDGIFITSYFGSNSLIHLYPKWIEINYSFVFGSNGGSGQVPNTLSNKTITSGVTIPTISLSKIGYSSSVWNTEENGSGVDLSPGAKTIDDIFITTFFGNNTQIHLFPKWVEIEYSFIFESNGGVGQVPNALTSKTVSTGASIPVVSLTKIGYQSSLWNTQIDGSGLDISSGENELDVAFITSYFGNNTYVYLYPKWVEIEYLFIFGSNGGTGQVPNVLNNKTITTGVTIPAVSLSKIGYSSSVWNTEEDGSGLDLSSGEKVLNATFITLYFGNNNQIYLYPKWVEIEYSFIFESNGGVGPTPISLPNRTITTGVNIPTISLSKIGYSSSVWNTEENGNGVDIDPGDKTINSSFITSYFSNGTQVHLYPKWVEIEYSFVFGSNGGVGQTPSILGNRTITTGVNIPTISLSKIGYSSSVWNTEENGSGIDLSPGTKTIDGTFITTFFGNNTQIHLYPKWVETNYSFIFESNGGIGQIPGILNNRTTTTGVIIPGINLTKIGYRSSVWNTQIDGSGLDLEPGINSMDSTFITRFFDNNEQLILYPKWVKVNYSITFSSSDSSGLLPDPLINFTIDSQITISSGSFYRNGYEMGSWNTSENNDGIAINVGDYVVDSELLELLFSEETTTCLYPVWTAKMYSVTLETECGTIIDNKWTVSDGIYVAEFTIESDEFLLPLPEPDDRFHDFVRWQDQNGLTVTKVETGTYGNIQLNAEWKNHDYSVSFTVNGRSYNRTYTIDDTIPDPESEAGFRFVGWYYEDQDGNETEFTEMSQMYEGISIHAVFEPIKEDPVMMTSIAAVLVLFFAGIMYFAFTRK